MSSKVPKVLAVASGGGHWVQLRRVAPAFEGVEVVYVTVDRSYRAEVDGAAFRVVIDATRWNKLKLLWMCIQLAWIVFAVRPDVVISTGAAPGYFAIRIGKLCGAKTMWIDSIANIESLSMSGQKILGYADRCLTQWEHLATDGGVEFVGAVL